MQKKKIKYLYLALVIIIVGALIVIFGISKKHAQIADLIVVDAPLPGMVIKSPLIISGKARGNWFFEASAPILLTDLDGKIIAQKYIIAIDPWMTADFVRFEGTLDFTAPLNGKNGFLILERDNPSGLPEYDKSLKIPILFN